MKKLAYTIFTVLFFGACLVPAVFMLLLGPSPAAANEILAAPPRLKALDGSLNLNVLSDAADYFSDHFAFRQELVTADSAMKSTLFHTSAQPDVALGQDGWLFYAETLDDYTGADNITARQAYCIAHSLKLAQDFAAERSVKFTFAIAPNKLSLYSEYGPSGLERAGSTAADLTIEALAREGVAYTDLFGPLGAQEEEMYLKLDSHWTNRGAALGHDLLLDSLGLTGHAFEKSGTYQESHQGDLYEMLYPASSKLDRQFEFDEPLQFEYTSPIRGVDDLRIQTASSAEAGPLLMFRDSFGNALHSLMAESFSEALFSRAMPYNLGLMEQIGAEYVVVELVERNLPLLAEAPFLMPAPQLDQESLPWGREELFQPEKVLEAPAHFEIQTGEPYWKVTGTVGAPCDPDSPVYLITVDGAEVWEAFPVSSESGGTDFAAYFDDETVSALDLDLLHVVFRSEDQWKLALNDKLFRDAGYLEDMGLLPTEGE